MKAKFKSNDSIDCLIGCESNLHMFHNHIYIKKINEIYAKVVPSIFAFELVTEKDVKREIQNLKVKKL